MTTVLEVNRFVDPVIKKVFTSLRRNVFTPHWLPIEGL